MRHRAQGVGINGEPFAMLKSRFREVGAGERRMALVDQEEGASPEFKLRTDPRVTRLAYWLRRLSTAELPHLFRCRWVNKEGAY